MTPLGPLDPFHYICRVTDTQWFNNVVKLGSNTGAGKEFDEMPTRKNLRSFELPLATIVLLKVHDCMLVYGDRLLIRLPSTI